MSAATKYHRVLLKISGEALMGENAFGVDLGAAKRIALEIIRVCESGIQVALVVGGGNIFRGLAGAAQGMDRATADSMGMLATVMNALALQNALEGEGMETRVMSAISMPSICESYIRRRALSHLAKNRVVVFAGGTGNPFFTTDTAAALRAAEIGCDLLLKGTQVNGVYSEDPHLNPAAKRFERLTYLDVLSKDLKVMDTAAISLARESGIPILVFSIHEAGAFATVLQGKGLFTLIAEKV